LQKRQNLNRSWSMTQFVWATTQFITQSETRIRETVQVGRWWTRLMILSLAPFSNQKTSEMGTQQQMRMTDNTWASSELHCLGHYSWPVRHISAWVPKYRTQWTTPNWSINWHLLCQNIFLFILENEVRQFEIFFFLSNFNGWGIGRAMQKCMHFGVIGVFCHSNPPNRVFNFQQISTLLFYFSG
jgi:hypothetical protein